jgi:two-component system OmpR family response regulator
MYRPTILIADDDAGIRLGLRKRLRSAGCEVVEAKDGLSVLSQCPQGWVDAIVLDYEMPNGNGQDVARILRHETDAPIIFLSGHRKSAFQNICTELSSVYFLPKPLDSKKMIELLNSVIEEQRI